MTTSLPTSRVPDPMDAPAIRWGILGPGNIATTFADSVRDGTASSIAAVGSRSLQRAQAFADTYGGRAHGSYEDLVNDDEVDAIYVATPHSEHQDHALLALEAGKPVLVEKAFTRNAREAQKVIDVAQSRQLLAMEAMWTRFLPHIDVVKQAVANGLIGDVRFITTEHGQHLYPNGPQRLEDPALAGGALLDLGIYSLTLPTLLMRNIIAVNASGVLTDLGVDESSVVTLTGENQLLACATSTMAAQLPNAATVAGTKARLEIDGWFYFPSTVRLVSDDDEVLAESTPAPAGHRMEYEAAEFARCLAEGKLESPLMPHAETLRVMQIMDDIRSQLGVNYPGE